MKRTKHNQPKEQLIKIGDPMEETFDSMDSLRRWVNALPYAIKIISIQKIKNRGSTQYVLFYAQPD